MDFGQRALLDQARTALYLLLQIYFERGGREDDWLPEAIQRSKMKADKKKEGKKP